MGPIHPAEQVGHPTEGEIVLEVNGEERQRGDLSELIWSVPEILAELSTLFELRPGDLIFTGTPSGVGPVEVGDHLVGRIAGLGSLDIRIAEGSH